MNNVLKQQLDEVLTKSMRRASLECANALRIGAATLRGSADAVITATTVVCDTAAEVDPDSFASLVQEIADDYALDASIRLQSRSYSVRFTLPDVEFR